MRHVVNLTGCPDLSNAAPKRITICPSAHSESNGIETIFTRCVSARHAQVIRTQYASPVGWALEVKDEMVEGVCKVVTKMTGKQPEKVIR